MSFLRLLLAVCLFSLPAFADIVPGGQGSPALFPSGVTGVTDGGDAAAGEIGEYVSDEGPNSGTLSDNVGTDVHSIVLQPGDWDVTCGIVYSVSGGASTTEKLFQTGTSASSGVFVNNEFITKYGTGLQLTGFRSTCMTRRYSLSVATTIYLVGFKRDLAGTSGTTTVAVPRIIARRMR